MARRDKLDDLLDVLCVEWGFCIPSEARERIRTTTTISAKDFANAVLLAEGMEPDSEHAWVKRIEGRFRQWFSDPPSP